LAVVLALAAAGCRSTAPIEPLPPASPVAPSPIAVSATRTPTWVGEPLTWLKLVEIETWLAAEGHVADPFWRVEGELALNQGRVQLSRAEKSGQSVADVTARTRVRTARTGFQRILAEEDATPGQKKRAEAMIASCDRMLGAMPVGQALALSVIPRTQWGAKPAHYNHMDKNRGGYRRITVHHSAEREPPELNGSMGQSTAAVRSIQKAHMDGKETGYGDIGYHFVVDPYGRVFQGREIEWQGAHAAGANNIQNIGICVIGNFDEQVPTKAALEKLRQLIDNLRSTWKIQRDQVLTHQQLKKTECPGRNLARWVEAYRRMGTATAVTASAK
jgi:hypothetical protein